MPKNDAKVLTELRSKMSSIYEKLNAGKEDAGQSEKYTELIYKLTNLNELTEVFYTQDENGEYPKVDELSLKALRDSYKCVIDVCDEISSGIGGELSNKIKDITAELKGLMQQDLAVLHSVKPDENISLGEIITEGRSLEFDAGNQKLGFVAGSINKRIPLKIKETGKEGFFTPTTNVDFEGRIKKIFDTASSKNPELKPLFDKMRTFDKRAFSNFYARGLSGLINMCERSANYKLPLNTPEEKKAGAEYSLKNILKESIKDDALIEDMSKKENFLRALLEIQNDIKEAITLDTTYVTSTNVPLKIAPDGNIDKRNAAMSTVADLLGCPDVIASSKPMIIYSDGKAISGTFMEKVPGYSPYDFSTPNNPIESFSTSDIDNPKLLKQIADIQALDMICGNVDRHPGNFIFQFEGEGKNLKLVGLKGIDNDMSLGLASPGMEMKMKTLPPVSDMQVISKDMADKILLMDPEVLKAGLKGYDLGKAEIDEAVNRLNLLKQAIEKGNEHYLTKPVGEIDDGFIRVVDEKDWDKYKLDKLVKYGNYFDNVKNVKTARRIARSNQFMSEPDIQKSIDYETEIFGETISAVDDNKGIAVEVAQRTAGVDYNLSYDNEENHMAVEQMIKPQAKEPDEKEVDAPEQELNENIIITDEQKEYIKGAAAKYGFTSLKPDAVKKNAVKIKALYDKINGNNTWGGSKNNNYKNMLRKMKELKDLSEKQAKHGLVLSEREVKEYMDLVHEVDRLADIYLENKKDINSNYAKRRVEGVRNLRLALKANLLPLDEAVKNMKKEQAENITKNYEFLKKTDAAIERLKNITYRSGDEFVRDCAYAIIGQMYRVSGGNEPVDSKTGRTITLDDYMKKILKNKNFKNGLRSDNNPKKWKNPKSIASMVMDNEKIRQYINDYNKTIVKPNQKNQELKSPQIRKSPDANLNAHGVPKGPKI